MPANPYNIPDRARRGTLDRRGAAIPQDVREYIASQAIDSQKTWLQWAYYSAVRFNAALTGAGPFVYTVAAGTRRAFGYNIGTTGPTTAGFPATYVAGKGDTNMLQPSQTRDNATVFIWGIAAQIRPMSDQAVAKQIWQNAYVEMQLNGTDQHLLGRLEFFPGGGGLYGSGTSNVQVPPLPNVLDLPAGVMQNGNPQQGNFFRLQQPIVWSPTGAGRDSALVLSCTVDNAIQVASIAADRAAAAGVAAYTHPADGTVFCDIEFRLLVQSISDRSLNQ